MRYRPPQLLHSGRQRVQQIDFELRGDYIPLDALLKATGLAGSGGQAKAMIAAAKVAVDGREELRKTCKIRAGQVVAVQGARVRVVSASGTGHAWTAGEEA